MDSNRAVELLRDASGEIRRLRSENELLRARMDVFDSIVTIVKGKGFKSENSGLMSPDLLWEMDKFIKSNEVTDRLQGTKPRSISEADNAIKSN